MTSTPPDDDVAGLFDATNDDHEGAAIVPGDENAIISSLLSLIEPGPDGLFGDRGLEGFVREFLEGFRGDPAETDDWSSARRFRQRYLTTASLGRLISNIRQNSDRALQGVLDGLSNAGDSKADGPVVPVVIDASFVRDNGLMLGTALFGAVTAAVANMRDDGESAKSPPSTKRPTHVPYRVDVVSIAQNALTTAADAGRNVRALWPSVAARASNLPAIGEMLSLAAGMLGIPNVAVTDADSTQPFREPHGNVLAQWADANAPSDELQPFSEDDD